MEKLLKLKAQNKNTNFQEFLSNNLFELNVGEEASLVLAGGALRSFVDKSEDPNDYDLFIIGDSSTFKQRVIEFLDKTYTNIFKCPDGFLYTYETPYGKLQLITPKIYDKIDNLLESFDFTACRAAFDGEFLFTFKSFVKAVKKKVLEIYNVSFPLATMGRMYKYRGYGYNIFKASEDFIRAVRDGFFPEDDMFQHYID